MARRQRRRHLVERAAEAAEFVATTLVEAHVEFACGDRGRRIDGAGEPVERSGREPDAERDEKDRRDHDATRPATVARWASRFASAFRLAAFEAASCASVVGRSLEAPGVPQRPLGVRGRRASGGGVRSAPSRSPVRRSRRCTTRSTTRAAAHAAPRRVQRGSLLEVRGQAPARSAACQRDSRDGRSLRTITAWNALSSSTTCGAKVEGRGADCRGARVVLVRRLQLLRSRRRRGRASLRSRPRRAR